jgi:hypothetical protein
MDLGFLAIDDLERSAGEVQAHAETRGVSHLVLIEDERPVAVLRVDAIPPEVERAIGALIERGDRLEPAPADIALGAGLTAEGLYLGEDFAVDMAPDRPLILLADEPGREQLLEALRSNSFLLAMADPALPGRGLPLPEDLVFLRCPVGPHSVLVPPGTPICPEHLAPLSQ